MNDAAHRVEHFEEVNEVGQYINGVLGLGHDPKLILYVAFFHDLFAWSRKNHHELSGAFVKGTCHPLIEALTEEERVLVSQGCEEHRASFKGEFSSQFSELMNSADRGWPEDIDAMLERAIQYRMAKGESREEAYPESVAHLKEKFGKGGYARYPALYLEAFGEELEELQAEIARL